MGDTDRNPAHSYGLYSRLSSVAMSFRTIRNHDDITDSIHEAFSEVKEECLPNCSHSSTNMAGIIDVMKTMIFVPYFPSIERPGWLKRYIMGPHTMELLESVFCDVWAGVIVALTLLPQGLSYAQLANLPAVTGLYSAVLPSAVYTFLGSSMQLGVGPVAIVSLLTGQVITKYISNPKEEPDKAIDLAGQISLVCGIYLVAMALFKAGNLIRFISHPVMSGFTSAAAMLIGLSQVKNAFGFPSAAPQTGQKGYDYNYQVMGWFIHNWYGEDPKTHMNYINPYAVKLTFGIYIPSIIVFIIKQHIPPTPERKKTRWFTIFTYLTNIMPLFAIVIGSLVAKSLIEHAGDDIYAKKLKVIGNLPVGLNILRKPEFAFPWGDLFSSVLPLTLISFMESYSVARRIATQRNELHILNANQELFAIGTANLLGSISSAFPVSGSFSRSSLNAASGARTPLSKATTMTIICISLLALTTQFYYIPNAALSAIIWVAITNLISPSDLWEAWKHSKKDFVTLFTTFIITLLVNTEYGLLFGILTSILTVGYDLYMFRNIIESFVPIDEKNSVVKHYDCLLSLSEVEYVRVNTDINFVTVTRMKDYIIDVILETKGEVISAIMTDFHGVHSIDLTGLLVLREIVEYSHLKGVLFGTVNMAPDIESKINKFGINVDSFEKVKAVIAKHENQEATHRHSHHSEPSLLSPQPSSSPSHPFNHINGTLNTHHHPPQRISGNSTEQNNQPENSNRDFSHLHGN